MANFMCDLVWWQPNDIETTPNPKRAVRKDNMLPRTTKKLLQIWSLIVACHRNWRDMFMHTTSSKSAQGERTTDERRRQRRRQVAWVDKWICYKLAELFHSKPNKAKDNAKHEREMSKDKDFYNVLWQCKTNTLWLQLINNDILYTNCDYFTLNILKRRTTSSSNYPVSIDICINKFGSQIKPSHLS